MENGKPNNGAAHQVPDMIETLVLTYNRTLDKLEVGGQVCSLDMMLDMLGRARRGLEFQQRKKQALEIQAATRQAAEDARIAAALRNGR